MAAMFSAWIDESGSNQQFDPGTYILSAVVCEHAHVDAIREVMRMLLVAKRHRKLHWRDEDSSRQHAIAMTIAALEVEHLVVVRSRATTTDHIERQRRLCMERFLPELVSMGVGNAVIESRGRRDDQKDRQTLDNLRRKHALRGRLHLDHVGGPAEPMLWIADACCGAVTQFRCGDPTHYLLIQPKVTMLEIQP
jgi:hypothetical protein